MHETAMAQRLIDEGRLGPYNGPCCLCGEGSDQRHRVADAIVERVAAGEDAGAVWGEYVWLGELPEWLAEEE
uniref:Uncharacterized protein n=1 Tax=viral metagenome TaxID=1070528 RepID=A0A6M3LRX6_9ZZZZ